MGGGKPCVEVSYISPYSATYNLKTSVKAYLSDSIGKYDVPISAQSIKKIRIKFNNLDNFVIKINSAAIDTPYLPVIHFNISDLKKEYSSEDLRENGFVIELTKISRILVVIPILLYVIVFCSLFFIFNKEVYFIFKRILMNENANFIVAGIIIFLILYGYVHYISVKSYLDEANNIYNNLLVFIQYFKYNALMLIIFILLFFILLNVKNKIVTLLSVFAISMLLIMFSFDTALRLLFDTRLNIFYLSADKGLVPDAATFLLLLKSFMQKNTGPALMILLLYTVILFIGILKYKNRYKMPKKHFYIVIGVVFMLISLHLMPDFMKFYFGNKVFMDMISVNYKETYRKDYSKDMKHKYDNYEIDYTCYDGLNGRKNIIVIFVESLSAYKSELFGGIENKTPYLDKMAKENMYIEEYYGNGINSSIGRMIFLTGKNYISSGDDIILKDKLYKDSIPAYFASKGYETILYSGADAGYGATNIIAGKSGINHIYDTVINNVYNKEYQQYVFNGVDDNVLYNSIMDWYKKHKEEKQPFFMLVTTVSSHQPYVDPISKTESYDKALSFADKAVYDFIEKLKTEDFFDNGIVVITGDHRAMLPISMEEYENLGQIAAGRIPLVIIDGKTRKKITGVYSHTDLGKSLEYIALDRVCFNPFQYNIFLDDNKEKCMLYQGLLDISIVNIKCRDKYGIIKLDGDETGLIDDKLTISDGYKRQIIDYINYLRISE